MQNEDYQLVPISRIQLCAWFIMIFIWSPLSIILGTKVLKESTLKEKKKIKLHMIILFTFFETNSITIFDNGIPWEFVTCQLGRISRPFFFNQYPITGTHRSCPPFKVDGEAADQCFSLTSMFLSSLSFSPSLLLYQKSNKHVCSGKDLKKKWIGGRQSAFLILFTKRRENTDKWINTVIFYS